MVRNKKKYWVLLPNSLLTVCWQCADRYSSKITPKYVKQYSFAAGSVKVRLVDTFVRECCFNFSLFILWPETRYYFHFPELTINTHKTFLSSILNKLNKKQETHNFNYYNAVKTFDEKPKRTWTAATGKEGSNKEKTWRSCCLIYCQIFLTASEREASLAPRNLLSCADTGTGFPIPPFAFLPAAAVASAPDLAAAAIIVLHPPNNLAAIFPNKYRVTQAKTLGMRREARVSLTNDSSRP